MQLAAARARSASRPSPAVSPWTASEPSQARQVYIRGSAFAALAAFEGPVAIIVAPSGYGKSALLSAIANHRRHLGSRIAEWSPGGHDLCAAPPKASWLLVDDAHLADPRDLLSLIDRSLLSGGAGKLILATRHLPEVDLVSLQLSGEAIVLDSRDLLLAEAEVAQLFERRSGKTLDRSLWSELHRLTGGWPLAAALCACVARRSPQRHILSLANWAPREQFAAYFERHRDKGLPLEVRRLLRKLAVLDQFSWPLASATLGCRAANLLKDAQSSHGLFVPSATREGWFELHSLYKAYLRGWDAGDAQRGNVTTLSAASAWCERHGHVDDAIEYLMRAGQYDAAQSLLHRQAWLLVRSTGDFARINDWVARLEAAAVPITARVRLWSIWSQCMQGRLAEARRMLADIETTAELGAFDRAFAERLWLDIAARSGTSEDVCGKAEAWLQRWSESSPLHVAGVALALALALFERGEEGAAGRRLAMAREAGFRVNGTYTRAWVLGVEAYVDLLAGHAHGAVALIGEALGVAREDSGTATPLFGALSQLAAAIYYEQGNLAAAQEYLGLGRRVHDAHVIDTRLLGQWAAAGLSNLEAGPDEALIELRRWRQDNPRFARATGLQTVHLLLRAGRWSDARAEFEATGRPGIADGAASTTIRQDCAYAEASVLFAEGDLPGAQTLTQAIVAHSEAHGRGQRLVAALLLRSAIEFARRDTPASDRTLARALNLAAAGGLVQTVLSLDWAVAERLGQVGLQGRLDPHVRTFVQALRSRLGLPPLREPGSGQRQSLEPLTAREREILAMLESDGSAQDLAASMSIGLATAKWHIRNVYTKLGVRSRAGALALARDVGLI